MSQKLEISIFLPKMGTNPRKRESEEDRMIAIIDYKAGNLTSVANALSSLGVENTITADKDEILRAERVIFPGVGAAASAMENLRSHQLDQVLHQVMNQGTPLLGICLGTQIILDFSEEDGGTDCVGLIPGKAVKFTKEDGIKIPHMGWNQVDYNGDHPVFAGIPTGSNFYFVHSYYPAPEKAENALATTCFGSQTFVSVLQKDNVISTQFHPEKSGDIGLQLLKNFSEWEGTC